MASILRGMNYGNQFAFDTPYPTLKANTAINIQKLYWGSMRVSLCQFEDNNGIDNTKTLALAAKAAGFYVSWGVTAGSGMTLAKWNLFISRLPTYAAWAQANGIDEFMLGNEEDLHNNPANVSSATVRSNILSAVAGVRVVYAGNISYSFSQENLDAWGALNTSGISPMTMNVYDNFDNFKQLIVDHIGYFGNRAQLSEWGAEHPFIGMAMTNEQYRVELKARQDYIDSKGIKAYFFTFDDNGVDGQWGIKDSTGHFRPAISALTGQPVGSGGPSTMMGI